MNYLLKILVVFVSVGVSSCLATAQSLRPVSMKVKQDLSKEVELQQKQAQQEWRTKLKNKTWFANDTLRKRCAEVSGCNGWAESEFVKDQSFHISHVQVEHAGIVHKDDKVLMSKITVSFLYTNAKNPTGRFKAFTFKNVPVNSKKCIECSRFRSNYMDSSPYGPKKGSYR